MEHKNSGLVILENVTLTIEDYFLVIYAREKLNMKDQKFVIYLAIFFATTFLLLNYIVTIDIINKILLFSSGALFMVAFGLYVPIFQLPTNVLRATIKAKKEENLSAPRFIPATYKISLQTIQKKMYNENCQHDIMFQTKVLKEIIYFGNNSYGDKLVFFIDYHENNFLIPIYSYDNDLKNEINNQIEEIAKYTDIVIEYVDITKIEKIREKIMNKKLNLS